MINVMIVEDQKMIRGLLEMYVENMTDYKLVSSIGNASFAITECGDKEVDLILMDVMTENDESGLDATAEIKKKYPDIKVLVVTSLLDDAVLKKAKDVGADSLWYKDVSQDELTDVVERTMNGEHIFLIHRLRFLLGIQPTMTLPTRKKRSCVILYEAGLILKLQRKCRLPYPQSNSM